jgi:hypothetical protein
MMFCRVVRTSAAEDWQQVAVVQQHQHSTSSSSSLREQQLQYAEVLQPAADPSVQRCLAALYPSQPPAGANSSSSSSSHSSSSSVKTWLQGLLGLPGAADGEATGVWLPTRCLQLLELLHAVLPQHTLIAADFDALPDVVVPGRNAPLVSGRKGAGVTVDYDTVLVPWGAADIFFPTDFDSLASLYKAAAENGPQLYAADAAAVAAAEASGGRKAARSSGGSSSKQQRQAASSAVSCSHSPTAEFMAAFAEAKQTRLLSGYNPLVQDWQNTRVFVGNSHRSRQ